MDTDIRTKKSRYPDPNPNPVLTDPTFYYPDSVPPDFRSGSGSDLGSNPDLG